MNKKILAIFMSMLIIMLPITFAAQLGTIRELKVYGTDGTDGYRRSSGDNTVVDALVNIDGDTDISSSQVMVQGKPFDECSDEGSGNFRCLYTEKESISYNPQSFAFKVDLFDDSNALSASKTGSVIIDVNAPEITGLTVEQTGKLVKLSYTVKDTACDHASCANKCAGLKMLDINGLKTVSINSSKCTYSGFENLELETGTYQLSVTAYDGVGNSVTKSTESFVVDASAPIANTDNAVFLKNGKEYFYLGANGQKGSDVVVYIEETSITEVVGDLSSLNKVSTYKPRYASLKAVCEDLGGISKCTWKDIYVWPDSNTGLIEVDIKDKSGNTGEASIGYSLKSDDGAPTVTAISTKCDGTRCYLREKNNTITVKINEAGSGFNRTTRIGGKSYYNVGLNLGEVSSLYNIKKSEKCESVSGVWSCYFYNIVADKGHGKELKVFISTDSMDDAGNVLSGKLEETFMVDIKEPVMEKVEIKSGDKPGYALEGDGLSVSLIVTDDTAVSAVGHFGGLTMDASPKVTSCSLIGDKKYECSWTNIGSIAPGPQTDVTYSIDVIDMAGNVLALNETTDIVEAEGLPKKYWMLDEALLNSPSAISKDTLFREQKVFFSVPLKSAVRDIKVVDAVLTNCSNRIGLDINPTALVTPQNSVFFGAIARPSPEGTAALTATCTLRIVSVVNKVRLAQPQDLVITMNVPLVSASLGTINDRVADKINRAKAEAKSGIGGIIDTLDNVIKIFNMICTLYSSIHSLTTAIHGFTAKAAGAADKASAAPGGEIVTEVPKTVIDSTGASTSGFKAIMGKKLGGFCNFITCKSGLGYGEKMKSTMNGWFGGASGISIGSGTSKLTIPNTGMYPNDPRNNLILSILWGCIPGIVMNLKKMKNVQCMYVDCLQNQVPKGTPVRYCDEQLGYQQCRFVYGQLFGVIPFGNALKGVGEFMKTLLSDPLSLVFGLTEVVCALRPPLAVASPYSICRLTASNGQLGKVKEIMGSVQSIQQVMEDFKGTNDVCKKVGL